jgi:hypothetical protein
VKRGRGRIKKGGGNQEENEKNEEIEKGLKKG